MNARIYDISMLTGLGLLVAGVHQLGGLPWALIAAGAGVIGLTAFGAYLGGRR
jgi:hypothetical protein